MSHTYLAQMVGTVVNIFGAVVACEAKEALAFIVGVVVDTSSTILAWVELLATEGNLSLTILT